MKKLLTKARRLYKKRHYQAAMAMAKEVLSLDRNNDEALFYLAHSLYHLRQFKKSLKFWERLKRISPTEPNLHLNMGACFECLGNKRLALQNYKRELALNPISVKALHNLGDIYFFAHKYKLAAGYFERCHSQKGLSDDCIGKLAHSYFKTGQLEKEALIYEEFLQTNPCDTWALNNLGSHLMGEGEYHRALLRLRKAAEIDPNDKVVAKNIRKVNRILRRLHSGQTPHA
jgi:tetratricopeptide (TPR) repeat protein